MSRAARAREERVLNDATLTMEQYKAQKARDKAEREARLRQRDLEYRRALGLDYTAELPKRIGTSGGTRNPSYSRIKGSKRMAS